MDLLATGTGLELKLIIENRTKWRRISEIHIMRLAIRNSPMPSRIVQIMFGNNCITTGRRYKDFSQ